MNTGKTAADIGKEMNMNTEIVRGTIREFNIEKGILKVNCSFQDLGVEVTRLEGKTLVTVFKNPEAGTGL